MWNIFSFKVEAKRKLSSHRQSVAATGGGPSTADLKSVDSKIAAIIGEVSMCGIVSEKEGDTDVTETRGARLNRFLIINAVHLSVWGDKCCQLFVFQSFRSLKLWVNRRFRVRGSQMQMYSVRLKAVHLLRLARPKVVRYSLTQSCSCSETQ